MRFASNRWHARWVLVASLLLEVIAAARIPARAQDRQYLGATNCRECHDQPGKRSQEFALLVESVIWEHDDPHGRAFRTLETPLGKAICEQLGIQLDFESLQDPQRAKRAHACLSCHAGWENPPPSIPNKKVYDLRVGEGVTCESCHGPSSDWTGVHWTPKAAGEPPAWRGDKPETKAEKGFVNVRDPVTRAEQCASCHVGDVDAGRVVTHDMYAAGHPWLPSFDVEAFADELPRHWRSLREKGAFRGRDKYVEVNFPGIDMAHEATALRGTLVGTAVALRARVALVSGLAAAGESEGTPDLAAFDCRACHHELRADLSGAPRRDEYVAGRPPMETSSELLFDVALHLLEDRGLHSAPAARQRFSRWHAAWSAAPFGNPAEVKERSRELLADIDSAIEKLRQVPCDRSSADLVLNELWRLTRQPNLEFNEARRLAWAIRSITAEILAPPRPATTLPANYQEWSQGKEKQAWKQIGRQYDSLGVSAMLGLPLRSTEDNAGVATALVSWPRVVTATDAFDSAKFADGIRGFERRFHAAKPR